MRQTSTCISLWARLSSFLSKDSLQLLSDYSNDLFEAQRIQPWKQWECLIPVMQWFTLQINFLCEWRPIIVSSSFDKIWLVLKLIFWRVFFCNRSYSGNQSLMTHRARICKRLRSPGFDSYLSYRPARLHRLTESIPGLRKCLQIRSQSRSWRPAMQSG